MPRYFTEVKAKGNPFPPVKPFAATSGPMAPKSLGVQRARDNFVGWLNWYRGTHPDVVPTQGAFAKALGITAGALTQLLAEGSSRAPQFKTLVGARNLLGMPIDALLFTPPPVRRV
jgi:hypothetical protein